MLWNKLNISRPAGTDSAASVNPRQRYKVQLESEPKTKFVVSVLNRIKSLTSVWRAARSHKTKPDEQKGKFCFHLQLSGSLQWPISNTTTALCVTLHTQLDIYVFYLSKREVNLSKEDLWSTRTETELLCSMLWSGSEFNKLLNHF